MLSEAITGAKRRGENGDYAFPVFDYGHKTAQLIADAPFGEELVYRLRPLSHEESVARAAGAQQEGKTQGFLPDAPRGWTASPGELEVKAAQVKRQPIWLQSID